MLPLRFKPLDYAAIAGFLVYSAITVATPIALVKMAEDLNFTFAEGGRLELVRSMALLVMMLLSAFAAAHWGKAHVLGVSTLILGCGMFLYALAPGYGFILVAMSIMGLSSGMLEALINPLVQDLHPADSGRYLNVTNGFWSVGVLATMLLCGEALSRGVSWRWIMAAIGVLCLVTGCLFLFLDRTPRRHSRGQLLKTFSHLGEVLRTRRFYLFAAAMVMGGGAEGAYTFWSASYIQSHFETLPRQGGFGGAAFAGGMIVGRFVFGHMVSQKHLKRLILLSAVAAALVGLAVPWVQGLWQLYVVLGMAGLSVACFWPSIQSYSVDCIGLDSTMIFILLSCAGIPGFGIIIWALGILAESFGFQTALYCIPVLFVAVFLLIAPTSPLPASRSHNAGGHS